MENRQSTGAARHGPGHFGKFNHAANGRVVLPASAQLIDERPEARVQQFGDDTRALLVRMNAVGLVQRRIAGHAREQKRHELDGLPVLAQELDAFRAERPDYIISDSVAPWGQWAAQLLDVPVVTSVTTLAVNRHVLAFAASRGARPKSARLVLSKIRHVAKAALLGRRLDRKSVV